MLEKKVDGWIRTAETMKEKVRLVPSELRELKTTVGVLQKKVEEVEKKGHRDAGE